MSMCNCSLAGTASCNYCSNNQNAERPPVVRSSAVTATDSILHTGQTFNSNPDATKKALDEVSNILTKNSRTTKSLPAKMSTRSLGQKELFTIQIIPGP